MYFDLNPVIYENMIHLKKYKGDKFTLKEYDKKIVSFCGKLDIIVEDDYKYLPEFFKEKTKELYLLVAVSSLKLK